MSEPVRQASGADAARQALAAWKAGRTPGQAPAPRKKSRRVREDRTGGRDPIGLGGVLGRIAAEQGWKTSLDGGSILDQWPTLCPQYVGKVQPVEFREEKGQLVVRPGSDAYAAQLRLLGGQLCKQINDKLGRDIVRSLGVLPVGALAATRPDVTNDGPERFTAVNQTTPPTGPVHTRDTASPGYHLAMAEHQAHKRTRDTAMAPYVREALERQNQALRAHREDEEAFTDAVAERERLEAQHELEQPADSLQASIQAALRYKHSGVREPRRLFEAS